MEGVGRGTGRSALKGRPPIAPIAPIAPFFRCTPPPRTGGRALTRGAPGRDLRNPPSRESQHEAFRRPPARHILRRRPGRRGPGLGPDPGPDPGGGRRARPAPPAAGHPGADAGDLPGRDPLRGRRHRPRPSHHQRAPDHSGPFGRGLHPAVSRVSARKPCRHRPDPAALRPDRHRPGRPPPGMAARHGGAARLPPRHPAGRDRDRSRLPVVDPAGWRTLAGRPDPQHRQHAVGEGDPVPGGLCRHRHHRRALDPAARRVGLWRRARHGLPRGRPRPVRAGQPLHPDRQPHVRGGSLPPLRPRRRRPLAGPSQPRRRQGRAARARRRPDPEIREPRRPGRPPVRRPTVRPLRVSGRGHQSAGRDRSGASPLVREHARA